MRRLLLLLPVALVAVACGGAKKAGPYLPGPTAACLRDHGFTVSTSSKDLELVIATADNGGLHAWHTKAGNQLEIAFMADEPSTRDELKAIRNVAPKRLRPHIADITRVQRNAVLLWTIAPSAQDDQTSLSCLSS